MTVPLDPDGPNRYEREPRPAPTHRRILTALAILAVVAAVVAVALPVALLWRAHDYDRDFLKIDACLDRGGRWSDATKTCAP